jgi:hypothetical protein
MILSSYHWRRRRKKIKIYSKYNSNDYEYIEFQK